MLEKELFLLVGWSVGSESNNVVQWVNYQLPGYWNILAIL